MSPVSHQFINYRSLDDLECALQAIALALPPSISTVVGIPRSGMLAASILALQLNLPFTDLQGFLDGRTLVTGRRPARAVTQPGPDTIVLDDSVASGAQMTSAREQVRASGQAERSIFAAPFVTDATRGHVDLFGEVVAMPRAFAWNVLHHPPLLSRSCVDIDGVLCVDPTHEDNDDGPRYIDFLDGAQPLFLPSAPVRYVVTSRLERYRPQTEAWLRRVGIEHCGLIMLDLPDAETRRALQAHARHKAEFYASSDTELFIESDHSQALEIAARSGRQVFAIDRREMVYPSALDALRHAPGPLRRSVSRRPPGDQLLEHYLAVRRVAGRVARPGASAVRRARSHLGARDDPTA